MYINNFLRFILTWSRMYPLRTFAFPVKLWLLKQHDIVLYLLPWKSQAKRNVEYGGHSLTVGGEVGILLSDLERIGVKPMHDKDMTQPSRLRTREDTYTSPKQNLTLIKEAVPICQSIY